MFSIILSSTEKYVLSAYNIFRGESDGQEEPFRQWYGKLGELRSLIQCPAILLTATANRSARKKLQQKFGMKNCHEIIDNPERENIKLFLKKVKCSTPLDEVFYFIIRLLKDKKELCPRFLIFCTSINACGQIVSSLRLHLHDDIKYVHMYHSKTPEVIKEEIKVDLDNPDGNIRVLVATSAAGMGVNFKGVYHVINYGPPKDMDSFVQEFGRAGRDGRTSMALLLFNGKQCKNLDSDMKNYVTNTDQCRRECLLNAYNCKPSSCVKHLCCDVCDKSCNCDNDCSEYQHPYFEYVLSDISSSDSDDVDNLNFEDFTI